MKPYAYSYVKQYYLHVDVEVFKSLMEIAAIYPGVNDPENSIRITAYYDDGTKTMIHDHVPCKPETHNFPTSEEVIAAIEKSLEK